MARKHVLFMHGILGPFEASWNPDAGETCPRIDIGKGRGIVLRDDTPEYCGARFEADVLDYMGEPAGTVRCETC